MSAIVPRPSWAAWSRAWPWWAATNEFSTAIGHSNKSWNCREGSSQGKKLVEALRQAELVTAVRQVLPGGEEVTGEVEVGTVRPRSFSVTAAPVHAAGPSSAVLVLHDITELRRLERVRQDFVANVSHEFKTPLTAIQGFAETLLGGALDDKANRKRFVEIIREHALAPGPAYR